MVWFQFLRKMRGEFSLFSLSQKRHNPNKATMYKVRSLCGLEERLTRKLNANWAAKRLFLSLPVPLRPLHISLFLSVFLSTLHSSSSHPHFTSDPPPLSSSTHPRPRLPWTYIARACACAQSSPNGYWTRLNAEPRLETPVVLRWKALDVNERGKITCDLVDYGKLFTVQLFIISIWPVISEPSIQGPPITAVYKPLKGEFEIRMFMHTVNKVNEYDNNSVLK